MNEVKVFEAAEIYGGLLESEKKFRLVFKTGNQVREVRVSSDKRHDLAMFLLGMDGAQARVKLTWPKPKKEKAKKKP